MLPQLEAVYNRLNAPNKKLAQFLLIKQTLAVDWAGEREVYYRGK
jgi:hypothetical protein